MILDKYDQYSSKHIKKDLIIILYTTYGGNYIYDRPSAGDEGDGMNAKI